MKVFWTANNATAIGNANALARNGGAIFKLIRQTTHRLSPNASIEPSTAISGASSGVIHMNRLTSITHKKLV